MATVLREAQAGHKMALDKDVEIKLSDGAVLRADVYRPEAAGKYPGDHDLRPLRQGFPYQPVHGRGVGRAEEAPSGDRQPVLGQAHGVRTPRPGNLGAARLRGDPCRLPRRRPLAGQARRQLAAGVQGLQGGDRVGRAPNRGATARSGCSASPTMRPANGWWPHTSRNTWPRSCHGRAPAISTATARATAASSSTASSGAGGSAACSTTRTARWIRR